MDDESLKAILHFLDTKERMIRSLTFEKERLENKNLTLRNKIIRMSNDPLRDPDQRLAAEREINLLREQNFTMRWHIQERNAIKEWGPLLEDQASVNNTQVDAATEEYISPCNQEEDSKTSEPKKKSRKWWSSHGASTSTKKKHK